MELNILLGRQVHFKLVLKTIVVTGFIGLTTVEAVAINQCDGLFGGKKSMSVTGIQQLSIVRTMRPQGVVKNTTPSPGSTDPILERARVLKAYDDFKWLSDLKYKDLESSEKESLLNQAKEIKKQSGEIESIRFLVENLFEKGDGLRPAPSHLTRVRWTLPSQHPHKAAFDYTEKTWGELAKLTPVESKTSYLPQPYIVMVPGSRFNEGYYWDTYFGNRGLLATGRLDLAAMQVENMLYQIETYGLVPNGQRDYYLSRSQPPVLSSMIREVLEYKIKEGTFDQNDKAWLAERAFHLVKKDYQNFWMSSKRLDKKTGLNHHYDDLNKERPERSAHDNEKLLGDTFRDVRAGAESGKDFTGTYEGQETHVAPVLLNSLLYKTEMDLAQFAKMLNLAKEESYFLSQAEKRKAAMNDLMWDQGAGTFRDFHFKRGKLNYVTADITVPLFVGLASKEQAAGVAHALKQIEGRGGVIASNIETGKQWDGPYGWAVHQMFAVEGLKNYGFHSQAQGIAVNWTNTIAESVNQTGAMWEKVDAKNGRLPVNDGKKYDNQKGFLWTNGVYVWMLKEILNVPFVKQP